MLGFTVKPDVNMSQIEKSRVRRCLFGPPDHDSIKKDLKKLEDQNISEMSTVYNFDFKNDVPLHGRYHWEVISSEHIPEFYKKGYESRKTVRVNREKCSRPSLSDSDDDSSQGNSHVCHRNDDEDSDMDVLARPLEFSSSDEEDLSSQNTEMCNINKDTENSESSCKSGKVLVQRQIGGK
ncbi:hypothetical protein KUTeg_006713 [Tegillarca granosa]|uniref:Cyclin-dependent kinase inhibitor domain-containing protein n=1 Tax=Tegillarca granosa TaxID=220873 RepID=A0ABQ9FFW2_TEGGR|nr:hypothetical protein KUTeg_006713 [Tegillarca granosa]